MATIFVRTTGNDSTGTGATGTPYLTVKKALSVAAAGDNILVGDGTYVEDSGSGFLQVNNSFASRVTVSPESGVPDKVTIKGSGTAWVVVFGNAQNIQWDQITFEAQAATVNGTIRLTGASSSTVTFTRCKFRAWGSNGTVNGCVTTSWTSAGMSNTGHAFSLCTFEQIGIWPCYGIQFDNSGTGGVADSMEIRDNTFNTAYYGMRLLGCTNVEVHGNAINSWDPINAVTGFQLGVDGTTGVTCSGTVTGNKVRARLGHAMILGAGCNGVEVVGNYVYGGVNSTSGQGLVIKECQNVRVENNTIVGGYNSGLYFKAAVDCQAFNNRVRARLSAGSALRVGAGDTGNVCQRLTVRRNLFTSAVAPIISFATSSGDSGGSVVDENVYAYSGTGSLGSVRGSTVTTLTGLRAAWVGYDKSNNDRNSRIGITHAPFAGTPIVVMPA